MMKMMTVLSLVIGLGLLPACTILPSTERAVSVSAPEHAPAAAVAAQSIVNETNVLIAAAYRELPVAVEQGRLTRSDAQAKFLKLEEIDKEIDRVQELLDLGLYADAEAKANAASKAFDLISREIYKRANDNE